MFWASSASKLRSIYSINVPSDIKRELTTEVFKSIFDLLFYWVYSALFCIKTLSIDSFKPLVLISVIYCSLFIFFRRIFFPMPYSKVGNFLRRKIKFILMPPFRRQEVNWHSMHGFPYRSIWSISINVCIVPENFCILLVNFGCTNSSDRYRVISSNC